MTIIFPRALPTVTGIESSRFGLEFNHTVFESPGSRVTQILKGLGSLWMGNYKLPPQRGPDAREWKSWLTSMEGPAGTFLGYDPDHRMPGGVAVSGTSSPLVMGAAQTGTSLLTDGWAANVNGLLKPGDYIAIGNAGLARQFKMITEQVDSDAFGVATLNFQPALHKPPADNAVIMFENPVGVFRMDQNLNAWDADRTSIHGFAFSFVEVPEVA